MQTVVPSPKLQNTFDYERAAFRTAPSQKCSNLTEILSTNAFDYYDSGSADEITKKSNLNAFQRIQLLPRVLVDVRTVDTSTSVLGTPSLSLNLCKKDRNSLSLLL